MPYGIGGEFNMAWILQYRLANFVLVDAGNNRVNKSFRLTSATDAEALTDVATILAALEAVTDCNGLSYTISQKYDNNAFALPSAGVQAEAKAVVMVRDAANASKSHTVEIPGPIAGVWLSSTGENSNVVDISLVALKAFVNLYDSTGEATLSDGESVETDGLIRGYRKTVRKIHG
jgi:hypothetical protein